MTDALVLNDYESIFTNKWMIERENTGKPRIVLEGFYRRVSAHTATGLTYTQPFQAVYIDS